jgi:MFS family permease
MVLDFADRQVVVATFPALQTEWGLSDAQLGALVSVVSVTVGLGAFPAALLVDRWSRVRAIARMGTVWSLAAAAAGAAQSFGQLLAARVALGAGETGNGPAAGALLASMFPRAAGRPSWERSRQRHRWARCWEWSSAAWSRRTGGGARRGACSSWPRRDRAATISWPCCSDAHHSRGSD